MWILYTICTFQRVTFSSEALVPIWCLRSKLCTRIHKYKQIETGSQIPRKGDNYYEQYFTLNLFILLLHFTEPESISTSSEFARGQVRSTFMRKAKRKALRMSVFIVATFIICWFPYYVIFTRKAFGNSEETYDPTLVTVLTTIGQSNSVLNPIIYGAFHLCKVHKPRLVGKTAFLKPSNNYDIDMILLVVRTTDVKCIKIRPNEIRLDISNW